jgi:N-acylneuraminate cytidylyltransferase/CMP-N,N'-diacetyllegionaminic acid synthase
MSEIIGLITARGGSKSIPGKNIKLLAGKPLIAWTIEAALQGKELSRVIVSTDDEKIAEVARQWGAEVPFMRPTELSQDDSSHISVVSHAIHWLEEEEGYCPNYIMLLQPTSPFRKVEDIRQIIQLAKDRDAVAVVSVSEAEKHPYLCKCILNDGTLADFMKKEIGYLRRQSLPPAYALNGAIYLNKGSSLLHDQTFLPTGTIAYIMPKERSLDVDTMWDWHMAELIMKDRHGHN